MNIYVGHSSAFDFMKELYEPIQQSSLFEMHEFFLPHLERKDGVHSKDIIAGADLFVAEVSFPSTGLGIELGWADVAKTRIVCLYKRDQMPSGALRFLTNDILDYGSAEELIVRINESINLV